MKQFILLVSLILLSSSEIRDNYKEQPSLANPNIHLSLTCPGFLHAENKVSEKPNGVIQEAVLTNLDQSWYSAAVENIMKEEYSISYSEEIKSYQSPNRANNLQFTYHTNGFTAKPRGTKIPLFDVNNRMLREDEKMYEEMEDWSVIFGIENEEFGIKNEEFTSSGNKASIENDNIRIDYTNTKEGMRQDFIIKEKISGDEGIQLLMNVNTDLEMDVSKDAVTFRSGKDGKDKMMYASLKAWDANGITLDAYFENREQKQFAIVVDDSNAEYPVTIDPLSLTPDWIMYEEGGRFGWSLSNAGDVNGDGYDDVAIGNMSFDKVFFYYGSGNGLPDTASKILTGLNGPIFYEGFGEVVSFAGDVNSDGFDDIVIQNIIEGRTTYLYQGSPSGINDTASWTLVSNDTGVFIPGGDPQSMGSGDFNGDGYDDIVLGTGYSFNYKSHNVGAYIFLGSDQGISGNQPAWTASVSPDIVLEGFGWSASGAGDVNADGYDDVVVGAPFHGSSGKALVYYGSPNKAMFEPAGWEVSDPENYQMGLSVSTAGDVNNDGFDDIILGSPPGGGGEASGKAYVFFGSNTGLSDNNFVLLRGAASFKGFGYTVSDVSDFNGDGFGDVAIGEGYYDGSTFLFFGNSNGLHTTPVILPGVGIRVSGAGDVNNDGFADVITGGYPPAYAFYGAIDSVSSLTAATRDTILQQMNELCISTFVKSQYGIPISGISVIYNVRGINQYSSVSISDSAGAAEFCYTGLMPGYDTVSISYEDLTETVHVTWDLSGITAFIKSVSPEMNANSAVRNSDIQVEFVMNMNSSTINSSNIKVYGYESGSIPAVISYNNTNRTATINPVSDFKTGEEIRVTLTSGIQNFANIPITPFTYSFIAEATGGGYFSITDSIDITGNVRAGDVDKDGDVDLLVGNEVDGLKVFLNDGLGHFEFTENIPLAGSQFELEDYDADGDLDVLSSVDNDHVRLFINNGNGNFSPSIISNVHLGKAGDFNNDGYPDMAYFSNGFDISININNNGTFHLSNTIAVEHECYLNCYPAADFKIEDMDNDGDLDIVVLHMTACENPFFFMGCRFVDVLKNDGQGNFTNINILSDPFPGDDGGCWEHVIFLTSLNFDNDNDMDLILSTKKISNSGNYQFQFSNMSFLYWGVRPNVFDFDGDRDLDVVYYDYIYWPEWIQTTKFERNDGQGNFTNDLNIDSLGKNLISADVDNDGDIDMVTELNGKVKIARNHDCNHGLTISGNTTITVGSENNIYVSTTDSGHWDISNYDNTQASIPPNSVGDTVSVSAGDNLGHFVLYFNAYRECGVDTLLSYHVYVDNPLPVELAAFTSSVSGRNVSLSWFTSSELNNSGFEIQRAIENEKLKIVDWSKIGFINGNGTSNQSNQYSFTDKNLESGNFKYRLKQIDFNGSFEYFELAEEVSIGIPDKYDLSQNYPNPFNPVTTINYDLPADGIVTIRIYDILGREMKTLVNEMKNAGYYKLTFNASDLSSGAYFYRMTSEDFVAVKKFVVLK